MSGKIVPFMSEVDNYEYLIKEALGESVDEEYVRDKTFDSRKYVIMHFFDFGEGIVNRVEGVDFLKSHPMMIDYQLEVRQGDVLKQPAYGRLRPGHFILGADDRKDVLKEAERIIKEVKVVFN